VSFDHIYFFSIFKILIQAALHDLYAECGDQMDTWIVGKTPIGVFQPPINNDTPTGQETSDVSIAASSAIYPT
jgi:hypothetical protein